MQIALTEQQREHLCQVRQMQLAECQVQIAGWGNGLPYFIDAIFLEREVVRLMRSMGNSVYLDLEGRIYIGSSNDGILPEVVEDPRCVASCIVRWSGVIGLPELVDSI